MSVQSNFYLMYGVNLPYKFSKEWEKENGKNFYETFESYIDDSAFNSKIGGKDGFFILFDGMNEQYIIAGKVLIKTSYTNEIGGPLSLESLSLAEDEKNSIADKIRKVLGIEFPVMGYWMVTHYR